MSTLLKHRLSKWFPYFLLLAVSAAVYLPFIQKIGLMNDDWYLIFAGKAFGPQAYSVLFDSDRPLRAWVMGPAFYLFGDNIPFYHLSGFLFRYLSSVCAYWIFQMIWPMNRNSNILISVLFVIYPGFLSQVNPIDYQSQLFSLFLATLSIALTVNATFTYDLKKLLLTLFSIITGIFYLGLVEYFFGFEALRIICIYLLNKNIKVSFLQTSLTTFRAWLPSALIPFGFIFWRVFLFESDRKATDIGAQLQVIGESPILNSLWLGLFLLQDTIKAAFLAWGVPLYNFSADLRLKEYLLSYVIAAFVFGMVIWGTKYFTEMNETNSEDKGWQVESIVAGLAFVILSLVPVILVNRRLSFEYFSRYALAASIGSALILAGLLYLISDTRIRSTGIAFLILIATLTHFQNGARAAAQTDSLRNFWWQVSWRVPEFQPETTLIANYPITAIEEDYFVWGPANLIYNSASTDREKIKPMLYAIVLNQGNLLSIMQGGERQPIERRGIFTSPDLGNILILSQPMPFSCVHVMDGASPILSTFEESMIVSASSYSNIDLIDVNAQAHIPPRSIFGQEPEHTWCYYFQKASLASQRGDWDTVIDMGTEAWGLGLRPDDKSEWLVFLRVYARLNQFDEVVKVAKDFKKDEYQTLQVCQELKSESEDASLTPEMQNLFSSIFCQK